MAYVNQNCLIYVRRYHNKELYNFVVYINILFALLACNLGPEINEYPEYFGGPSSSSNTCCKKTKPTAIVKYVYEKRRLKTAIVGGTNIAIGVLIR